MKLRDAIKFIPGLDSVVQKCSTCTSDGLRLLMDQEFVTDRAVIESRLYRLDCAHEMTVCPEYSGALRDVRHQLMQLRGCRNTLDRLDRGEMLDEIEFFELKNVAVRGSNVARMLLGTSLEKLADIPDLTPALEILDPEKTLAPNFYLYEAYDPRLAPLRAELNGCEAGTDRHTELTLRLSETEREVCHALSRRLHPLASDLSKTYNALTDADMLLAKASAITDRDSRAVVADNSPGSGDTTVYKELVNPAMLGSVKHFQPLDIRLTPGCTVITGANMCGKTVALKTLALAQALFQFGFYVPAREAIVKPVSRIYLIIGDEQSEFSGLSSYASEMLKIDDALKGVRADDNALVLIDEPARTTNPAEGAALVTAMVRLFDRCRSFTILTTHYTLHLPGIRRLRVRGLRDDVPDNVTPGSLGALIDYTLTEEDDSRPPREALRIARLLGVEDELLKIAEENIE